MSLSADISTLNSALQAFTYGQSVTAENIANVNTPGYTSEVLNLESLADFSGVAVAGVGSTRDTFLYNQIYGQLATQAYDTAQLSALNQIAAIIPEVNDPTATGGLNAAVNTLAAAWTTLAADPTSTADQTAVLNDMQALSNLFNTDANQLYTLQQSLNTQVGQSITQVNSLEDQILTLNKQIVDAGGQQNAETSTLIDQREQDAESLTALTGATVNYDLNGAMVVTFQGGTLVDGNYAYHLGEIASATTPGVTDIGYVSVPNSSNMVDVTSDFLNGTLAGLYAGQNNVNQAVLTLNKMASGIINFSNEVNESGSVPLTNSSNALFTGTQAANMAVNPELTPNGLPTNLDYILAGNSSLDPGNLAAVQGAMMNLDVYSEVETINPTPGTGGFDLNAGAAINPATAIAGQVGLFATEPDPTGGVLVINPVGGSSVSIPWNTGDSLDYIVNQINLQGGGDVYATLQTVQQTTSTGVTTGQYIHIYSDAPVSVSDQSGNLGAVLSLNSVLYSSAPINNGLTAGPNQVEQYGPAPAYADLALNSAANELALFTQPDASGGTVEVQGNAAEIVTWTPNESISDILAAIQATAAPGTLSAGFNQATQQVELINVGPPQNPGVLGSGGPALNSVSINDLTGNLTQVLNLDTNTTLSKLFSQMTITTSSDIGTATTGLAQATSLVKATQALQTQQSGVDNNVQMANAALYENAYDAAVRLQYVLENMLNFLITQTGTPNSNSSPIGS